MATAPRYEIRYEFPLYDDRDGICGWGTGAIEMRYGTVAGALVGLRRVGEDSEFRPFLFDLDAGRPVTYEEQSRARGFNVAPESVGRNEKAEHDCIPF